MMGLGGEHALAIRHFVQRYGRRYLPMYRAWLRWILAALSNGIPSPLRNALPAARAQVGDITPHCNVSKEEKARLETEAIVKIQGLVGAGTAAAADISSLWHEYEAGSSPEALLVKDFDKLEMILQVTAASDLCPCMNAVRAVYIRDAAQWAQHAAISRQK